MFQQIEKEVEIPWIDTILNTLLMILLDKL